MGMVNHVNLSKQLDLNGVLSRAFATPDQDMRTQWLFSPQLSGTFGAVATARQFEEW
jgi:hypothetical protein